MYFIHINKTGGTFISRKINKKNFQGWYHQKRPPELPLLNSKFAFFVRNPISRYVSGFNHLKYVLDFKIGDLDIEQLNIKNCPSPARIRRNIIKKRRFVYNKEFDYLLNSFKNANQLAESLSSKNTSIRKRAINLMSYPKEHLYKGIGWYFNNGDWLKRNKESIAFVGTQENLLADLNRLLKLLNSDDKMIKNKDMSFIRESPKTDLYLSEEALYNIYKWYEKTDYEVLRLLKEWGYITPEYFRNSTIYKHMM